ncbi:hypothetical protein [Pseudoalteromonas sp. H103]|uniref:hypothetical protein n=1 Tax=Pseudoalteromonas sp. H103 TaxID=1761893 RepID=UPI00073203EF|nr:hypothetical protein [Pseudoalteromonas sp. H103]KTF10374.1 hypothetical protein ATS74_10495 [Pseudoalteromonas sp. H103]
MDNKKSECIGLATFEVCGETIQFGLTKDDFDMFRLRKKKLQDSIKSMTDSLKHFSEERVKLESQFAVIHQPEANSPVKD